MISDDPISTQLSSDPSSGQAQISYDPTSTQLRSQLRFNCPAPSPPSPPPRIREVLSSGPTRGLRSFRSCPSPEPPGHVEHVQMSLPEPPGHGKHIQMSRSAALDGTCLHLPQPAQISRPPRDLLWLAQTNSDHLSLAQILSDSSAASRKHLNSYHFCYYHNYHYFFAACAIMIRPRGTRTCTGR